VHEIEEQAYELGCGPCPHLFHACTSVVDRTRTKALPSKGRKDFPKFRKAVPRRPKPTKELPRPSELQLAFVERFHPRLEDEN